MPRRNGKQLQSRYSGLTRAAKRMPGMFTYFPDFPKEIREMIWAFALPGPRLIELEYLWDSARMPMPDDRHYILTFEPPPKMASVTSESRSVCLKYYKYFFDHVQIKKPFPDILFDFEIDTVYFGIALNEVSRSIREADTSCIRNLAINRSTCLLADDLLFVMAFFQHLTKITIVTDEFVDDEDVRTKMGSLAHLSDRSNPCLLPYDTALELKLVDDSIESRFRISVVEIGSIENEDEDNTETETETEVFQTLPPQYSGSDELSYQQFDDLRSWDHTMEDWGKTEHRRVHEFDFAVLLGSRL